MNAQKKIPARFARLLGAFCLLAGGLAAQTDVLTDPPDTRGPLGGLTAASVESIDPVGGALRLAIPIGQLAPLPGGFSGDVSLLYNSNIYDVQTNPVAGLTNLSSMTYVPSTHGGGWSYGYKFTLWSQPRTPVVGVNFLGQSTCSNFNTWEQIDWFKTFIQTPDGANHVLRLIALYNPDGSPNSTAFQQSQDASNNYYGFDFSGTPNRGCFPSASSFLGTMVFATVDGTYIRIEAHTNQSWNTQMWTAYLPNGMQASGPINWLTDPVTHIGRAVDSDSYTITDRNGNQLTLVGNCAIGTACTETIWDSQGRDMTIQYTSKANQTWQDVITSPGVNEPLISYINWQTFDPGVLTYPCRTDLIGSILAGPCSLQGTLSSIVTSVQLPPSSSGGNSTIYAFGYTAPNGQRSWGEVHSLTKCAGTSAASCSASQQLGSSNNQSTTQYSYYYDPPSPPTGRIPGVPFNPISSRTLSYQEQRDGSVNQTLAETTTYSVPVPTSIYVYPVVGTSTVTAPNGAITRFQTTNICTGSSRDFCLPMLYKVTSPDGTTTELGLMSNTVPSGFPSGFPFNPYLHFQAQSVNGKVKSVAVNQDGNGNTTSLTEYDWYAPYTPSSGMITGIYGSALRTTTTSFYTSTPYWTVSNPQSPLLNLRAKQSVQVGTLTSTYTYDSPLTTANLTSLQQTDSATSASITSSWSYLTNGNVSSQTINGVATNITYDGANLYPTRIAVGGIRSTNYSYDFNSGLELSETDDNQVQTVYGSTGYDDLGRQIRVEQTGGGLDRVTTTTYDDVGMSVTTTRTLQSGQTMSATTYLDALGRVRYTIDEAGMKVQKAYRFGSAGVSYELESNPYGSSANCGASLCDSLTTGWALTTRDAMGRVTGVQNYPGSNLPGGLSFAGGAPAWGSNTTSSGGVTATYNVAAANCTGPGVSVTDEANNTRTSCSDGAGRLIRVIQPDTNTAVYNYDATDDLLTVNFAGQWRRFEYSLGRLTAACNPEAVPDGSNGTSAVSCSTSPLPATGVDRYSYYANGTLQTHTNARGVATTFQYDGLNRVTYKSYNDGTPAVTYQYDQDYKGALFSVTNAVGNGTVYHHDGFGRVSSSMQTTVSYTYPAMSYSYALTDQLTSITYPSGRKVTYTLDAAGRINSVAGSLNGVGNTNYASNLQYAAHGGLASLYLGSGMTESYTWNDRLQQTGVSTGTALTMNFYPCAGSQFSCSNNNGNIQQQSISLPGASATQQYGYDSLNRLTVAAENGTPNCGVGGGTWCQHYSYDTAGNRVMDQSYGYGGSTWEVNTFNTATNRIANANWHYDDTGNITKSPINGQTLGYDAENRQVSFCAQGETPCPSQWTTGRTVYVYDGLGQRVARTDVFGNQTVFVYDAFGNLAAEYAPNGPPVDQTQYVTVDNLGSTRLITGLHGTERHDYYPFGFEITGGWRTMGLGYGSTNAVRQQFTGAEYDSESSLNFLQARYLSTPQGRFTSVDPRNAGTNPMDPQSWNGYSYVSNAPTALTDPSGLGIFGDLGSIIGSFFPGLGTLIGWGIGSIADLATGQSISPPGFVGLGSDIFGSITGSVNTGPWNEQWPIGGGMGPLNTGTVFGSGNTGPFIFSLEDGATQPQTTWQFFRSYWSTGGFLFNFVTGTGPRVRYYGPNDYRARDLMSSKGFQVVNQQIKQGCQAGKTHGTLNLSTWQGYKDIPYDIFHSPVGGEAGGYNGTWSASGGTSEITIVNYAGAYSFFYHAVNDRTGTSGPFRTIKQTFVIKEPSPCGGK